MAWQPPMENFDSSLYHSHPNISGDFRKKILRTDIENFWEVIILSLSKDYEKKHFFNFLSLHLDKNSFGSYFSPFCDNKANYQTSYSLSSGFFASYRTFCLVNCWKNRSLSYRGLRAKT